MLISRGFHLRDVRAEDFEYTAIDHNGEQVGAIWEDSVNIAHNYPSINPSQPRTYANTDQQSILFMSPMKMLEDAIEFLLDSPSRLDREMRDQRVENVRKYFDTRKERREMQEWMV
jgi:hypothetical protein